MNSLAGAVVLTKTGGILGPIAGILGWIMDLLFRFTSTFGIENIGLCIILFTLVTKLLMMPLTIKQQKSSKLMAVMQPEINAIQKKYKGKENDQKSAMMMQAEMKAVYEKYGTSMTGGCLPLAIQMPIIFALYRVIYNIPAYVQSVRGYYETVISQLPAGYQTQDVFTQLAQACRMTGDKFDFTNVNTVIDLLYKFTAQQWQTFIGAFPAAGEAAVEGGVNAVQAIEKMQNFFGLNIADQPLTYIKAAFVGGSALLAIVAILIPILAWATQMINLKLMPQAAQQSGDSQQDAMMNSMKTMNMVMPLMSAVFCFTFPVGLGIYWVASAAVRSVQQVVINKKMDKIQIEDLISENMKKMEKKREKAGLPPQKITNQAHQSAKNINKIEKGSSNTNVETRAKKVEEAYKDAANAKPGSITAKANLVKAFDERNKKK